MPDFMTESSCYDEYEVVDEKSILGEIMLAAWMIVLYV